MSTASGCPPLAGRALASRSSSTVVPTRTGDMPKVRHQRHRGLGGGPVEHEADELVPPHCRPGRHQLVGSLISPHEVEPSSATAATRRVVPYRMVDLEVAVDDRRLFD